MDNEKEVKSGLATVFEKEMEAIKAANEDIEAVIEASEGPIEKFQVKQEEKIELPVEDKTPAEKEKELVKEIEEPEQYRSRVLEIVELRQLLSYSQLENLIKCGLLVVTVNHEKFSILEPTPGSMISSMIAYNNTKKLDFVTYIKAIEAYKESKDQLSALQYIRSDISAEEVKEYFR